ncbi:hypothetical protein RA28_19660 [Ruegeria sp. ANG-S4]|uniref:terminase TerL endonuclease subunit n=1 Tax=Ruegeria sp. ANG-S4 TaxID=1577904 RepID=UPI00058007E0|nr:terminase TerL endonuclease subunit [Ruegeria sp. ANG-S4]KIC43844.1 hypothetical protein RA28_19660 [Ruegeria sp. ANG-S4]
MSDSNIGVVDYDDIKNSVEKELGYTPDGWAGQVTDLFQKIKEHCDKQEIEYAGSSLYTPAEERGYDIDGSEPDILAIRQTIQGLNAPIQRIERQMLEGKLIADNGPALAWCVSNVLISQVGANTKLEREQQGGKIDALAAMIDAAGMIVMRRPRVVDLAAMIG